MSPVTIGEFLRQKREEKQLSLLQVSEGTNIRLSYLQAIEENAQEKLPSSAHARGFARLYASYLGLDPKVVFDEIERPALTALVSGLTTRSENEENKPEKAEVSAGQRKMEPSQRKPASAGGAKAVKSPSQAIFEEIGENLRKQRENLGLSLNDVERQIKIREYYLYVLEAGRIEELPSTVQGRGMLNNYASFMDLDPEVLQNRYAEGLLQRRTERHLLEEVARKSGAPVMGKAPLNGWRRVLTPDLLIGGSVFLVLFFLVVWGAIQVIKTSLPATLPPTETISAIMQEAGMTDATPSTGPGTEAGTSDISLTGMPEMQSTPLVNLDATLTALGTGPVQVVIVAYQRAFMRVTVDGQEAFNGRVVPGNVYTYSGSTRITFITGNAAAVQIYYNKEDLGVLGQSGQVVALEFSPKTAVTPTPRFSPTPTITQRPTLTPLPTKTPLPTATVPTATITPAIPSN